jgi:hypothetical protein
MAIKKPLTLDSTGAPAAYHVVSNVSIDALGKTTTASLMSYVSPDTFVAGKMPVQSGATITVTGTPAADEGAFAYIHRRLVEPRPKDSQPGTPSPFSQIDRYFLAGGEIVS